ncbi:hypothetical protein KPH14_005512 [Odynerus spinipes]|uniref:Ionotropic glutamate receptor C-terminal domain-containing protein n=1 Tax=Odynerus spinipes TaxID=1348599 RepID=A0AAD9VKB7_9HYME|nr:hypothetical protein KPH14_005512 [Odynerus spinipes]
MSPKVLLAFLFFLFTGISVIGVSVSTEDYVLLISEVHAYYSASCVLFVQSGNYDDLRVSTMMHTWSREFSRQGILSLSISFTDLVENKRYQHQVVRPLLVILLSTWETLEEFAKVTRRVNVSLPVWFVIFMHAPGNPLEDFCKNPVGNTFNLNFSTEMLILCYDEAILQEWYAVQDNRTRTFNLATWRPGQGLYVTTKKSLYARRSDLFGTVFRVGTVKDSPFIKTTKNGSLTLLFGEVVMELSKTMNFTPKALEPVDAYGNMNNKDHIWNGVIGQVAYGEADFGVAEFTVTNHRLAVVDFTLPLVLSRNRLYMKEPSAANIQWSGYFKAFNPEIWVMIILLIITTPILLTVMKTKGCISGNIVSDNYIHVWGIYCQQGLSEFPSDPSLRLAFISIFVSAIIVSAAYSASLISFLTVTSVSLPFSNLDDFANDGSYKLIVFVNSADYDMFATSKDSVIMKMMKLMKPQEQLPTSLYNGFEQVCQEKVAFYTTEVIKNAISTYLPCKVNFIETGRSDSLAMALPKDSPFTGVLNYHLQRFQDNGIMHRLRELFITKQNTSKASHTAYASYRNASSVTSEERRRYASMAYPWV